MEQGREDELIPKEYEEEKYDVLSNRSTGCLQARQRPFASITVAGAQLCSQIRRSVPETDSKQCSSPAQSTSGFSSGCVLAFDSSGSKNNARGGMSDGVLVAGWKHAITSSWSIFR